jgi:hypothetical protein
MKIPLLVTLLLSPLGAWAATQAEFDITPLPLMSEPFLSFDRGPADHEIAWQAIGSPDQYRIGTTRTEGMLEPEALFVGQRGPASHGRNPWGGPRRADDPAGGALRTVSAENFRGQRVRLSARFKTRDAVSVQLFLWALKRTARLGYDMSDRAIHGTTDWRRYEIVMDVPPDAEDLSFGFFVSGGDHLFLPRDGNGMAWGDSFTLEAVDKDVPVSRNYLAADYRPSDAVSWNFGGGGLLDSYYYEGSHVPPGFRDPPPPAPPPSSQ